jgi:ABC-type transporter Mla MlaB component
MSSAEAFQCHMHELPAHREGVDAAAVIQIDCAGLERIQTGSIALLLGQRSTTIHFVNGEQSLYEALALLACGRDWRFPHGFSLTHIPIRVRPAECVDEWCIHLAADTDWAGWMKDEDSILWARHLQASRLWVDLVDLGRLRSVVIGWLLSLRQELRQVPISLVNVDARALSVLQQMRLGSIFEIEGLDPNQPGVGSSGLRRLAEELENG